MANDEEKIRWFSDYEYLLELTQIIESGEPSLLCNYSIFSWNRMSFGCLFGYKISFFKIPSSNSVTNLNYSS